ncbi:hypothetical protein, partial [Thiolapillus sp.]
YQPKPGVSREQRLSTEGLQRLEKQLQSAAGISDRVLAQWIRRYGDAAKQLILASGRDLPST